MTVPLRWLVTAFLSPLIAATLASQSPGATLTVEDETAATDAEVAFEQLPDRLQIAVNGRAVGEYVLADPQIRRPYFSNLRGPGGVRVTRRHPPEAGVDSTDCL